MTAILNNLTFIGKMEKQVCGDTEITFVVKNYTPQATNVYSRD